MTTIERIAQLEEDRQFWLDNSIDFSLSVFDEIRAIDDELHQLRLQLLEEDFVSEVEEIIDTANELCYEEDNTIEAVVETVEDDWLLEEWEEICNDPRGTRFSRPRPVFINFIQYLLYVTGQLVRDIRYNCLLQSQVS